MFLTLREHSPSMRWWSCGWRFRNTRRLGDIWIVPVKSEFPPNSLPESSSHVAGKTYLDPAATLFGALRFLHTSGGLSPEFKRSSCESWTAVRNSAENTGRKSEHRQFLPNTGRFRSLRLVYGVVDATWTGPQMKQLFLTSLVVTVRQVCPWSYEPSDS